MGADADRGGFTGWADLGRLLELDGDLTLERALLAADGNGRPEHDPGRRLRSLLRRMGAFAAGALTAVGAMTLIGRLNDPPAQEQVRQGEAVVPAGASVARPDAVVLTLTRPVAPVDPARHRPKGKGAARPKAAAVARPKRAAARPATPPSTHVRGVQPAPAAHHRRVQTAAPAPAPAPKPAPVRTTTPAPKPVIKPAAKPTPKPATKPTAKPTTEPTTGADVTATVPATGTSATATLPTRKPAATPTPTCTDTGG